MEICTGVAPPVPAAHRVDREIEAFQQRVLIGRRLRVQDDDVVGFRPAVVAGMGNEGVADRRGVLQAAVEGDMQAAARAGAAALRDIDVADRCQAGCRRIIAEGRLIEGGDRPRLDGWPQRAVQVAEQFAGQVVVAIHEERRFADMAGRAEVGGDHRVRRRHVIDQADPRAVEEAGIVVPHRCPNRRRHQIITGAGKQEDAVLAQAGGVVDGACRRLRLRLPNQTVHIGRAEERRPAAQVHADGERARQVGGVAAAGAVVRPTGDDSGAGDRRRVSDVQLVRHEPARRDAGHGHRAGVDGQRRERFDGGPWRRQRFNSGPRRRGDGQRQCD